MDSFFDTISPDGHAVEVCSLPNKPGGITHRERVTSGTELDKFIAGYDHPGRALYFTVAKLRDGMTRSRDAVEAVYFLWAEVDFKDHPDIAPEEIRRRLDAMPMRATFTVFSGHGFHVYWQLNEAEDATPGPGQEAVRNALQLACRHISGDPAVAEPARLMRLPGSHNTRVEGENILVEVVAHTGLTYEMSELVDCWTEARPILPAPAKGNHGGTTGNCGWEERLVGPVDVEARLGAMCFKAPNDENTIHTTQVHVTASLTGAAQPVEETVERVLAATKEAVAGDPRCAGWDWAQEKRAITEMCFGLVNKAMKKTGEDLGHCLPDVLYDKWQAVVARGERPVVFFNRWGASVRGVDKAEKLEECGDAPPTAPIEAGVATVARPLPEAPFVLRPFTPFDPSLLPPSRPRH
jgi:hypothetical protein